MQFTCTSWSWSLLSFADVVRMMSMLGFRAIDVGAFASWAHFEPDDLAQRPEPVIAELNEIKQREQVALTDLIVTFGPDLDQQSVNDPDQAVRDKNLETFKRLVWFCQQVGIPGITVLPGIVHESIGRDASLDLAINELARLADAGHQGGLRVGFEPHFESISESPTDALKVVQAVPHLTFTLDYSHFIGQNYTEAQIDPLLEHTGHFHVRQAKPGVFQSRGHEGSINFDRILSRLEDLSYAGCVSFEYVWELWQDNDRVDVLSETILLKRQLAGFQSGR
jgi:sugar phosphate isomerase/epimerase